MKVEETNSEMLSQFGQENVTKLGKVCVEAMKKEKTNTGESRFDAFVKESLGTSTESLDVGDSQLYTTAIAGFIERRLRPNLVAENVIKVIDNFDTRGQDTLKVPLRDSLISASDLGDDGSVSYDSNGFGSTSIQLRYKYAANSLTHEITKFANVDLIAEELGEIGYALARKVDSDIISALDTNTSTPTGNALRVSGSDASFANLLSALQGAWENYASPDVILLSPESYVTIMGLDEFSGGSNITGSMAFKGANGENFPLVEAILRMRVVVSNEVDDDHIYLIDTQRNGYLVKAGGVETFDGRRSGYLAYEVIGALNYGVGLVQPKAVYKIVENT